MGRAAATGADLIESVPKGLERYVPRCHYLLIEETRYGEAELASQRNLAAALFRLENSHDPEQFGKVVGALIDWLQSPAQDSLTRAFLEWMKRVFLPSRLPNTEICNLHIGLR